MGKMYLDPHLVTITDNIIGTHKIQDYPDCEPRDWSKKIAAQQAEWRKIVTQALSKEVASMKPETFGIIICEARVNSVINTVRYYGLQEAKRGGRGFLECLVVKILFDIIENRLKSDGVYVRYVRSKRSRK